MFARDKQQPQLQQESEGRVDAVLPENGDGSSLMVFVKKHRLLLGVVAIVIALFATLYGAIPVVSLNQLRMVNLNTGVRLEEGKTVRLKTRNVSVQIARFINDTCPVKGTCFGPGVQAVEYYLTVDGKKYATGSEVQPEGTPYRVETIDSDYKTYVTIKIVQETK